VEEFDGSSQDGLAGDGAAKSSAHSRRSFLKKAAGIAVALPTAGAVVGAATAAPRVSVGETAQPYAGVTLQFAKAPFGNDEAAVISKLLAPFEKSSGIKVVHTEIPWTTESAAYSTNYGGPNPYDVSYQTSTDLTGLGTKGVLEVLNTSKWLDAPTFASTKAKFVPNVFTKSTYQGKLYGLPCIIGATVVYYNKDLLAKSGVTTIPTNTTQLAAAALRVMKNGGSGVWGYQAPMTDADSNWYFQYHNIHNLGTDIISPNEAKATFTSSGNKAALQTAVNLLLKYKVQPPVGQYNRDAGVSLFQAGKVAFLDDEPLRLPVFNSAKLPFKWDFVAPMAGTNGKRTVFSTTGHWVMASKSQNLGAAWELVKYLSSPAFANFFGAHYGWAPVRTDVDTSQGNAQVKRVNKYVLTSWDGLPTGPKMAQLTDIYGQAIEAAASGHETVASALAKAQSSATATLG
jgi:ABC-type glycerol-3-phosphate transport system substrate-binding protein